MAKVLVIIAHAVITKSYADYTDHAPDDKSAEQFLRRAQEEQHRHRSDLDDTTLRKAGLPALPTNSRIALPQSRFVSPYTRAQSSMTAMRSHVNSDSVCAPSPFKKPALAAIESLNLHNRARDVSMKAVSNADFVANLTETKVKLRAADKALTMPGITAPLGFFDPVGFIGNDCTMGKLLFYREVEIKHGRVGMLASLGFLVGEQFHPLFGGNIDVPSYVAFQETPLQEGGFWIYVLAAIAIPEILSIRTFNAADFEPWTIKEDHESGNFNFDPLGLKPTDPEELKEMQTKELNNGRLAMLAAAGMIAQELATGKKLF